MEKVEIDIDGKTISLEAGDLARQAGGYRNHLPVGADQLPEFSVRNQQLDS